MHATATFAAETSGNGAPKTSHCTGIRRRLNSDVKFATTVSKTAGIVSQPLPSPAPSLLARR